MQVFRFILLLLLFFLSEKSDCIGIEPTKSKAIYLISTPRSCSTAFLRMMHARGDFEVFNEPGVITYFSIHKTKKLATYHEVEKSIAQKMIPSQNIFVKELGYAACEYLLPDSDFLKHQDYNVVFLVRNPHNALISHYKKTNFGVMKNLLQDILSYKKLYELFQEFKQKTMKQPWIILSEELVVHPRKILTQFCYHTGIPFKEESLSWQQLGKDFSFKKEWNCDNPPHCASHWHDSAMASTGFESRVTSYAVDEDGQPTFEEIENLEHRTFYKQLYDENLPYYKLFLDEYHKIEQNH